MREQRLMERLNVDETVSRKTSEEVLVESVMSHLQRLLNVRKGSVKIQPTYGVAEFESLPGHFSSPETDAFQREIEQTIEQFEPRFKNVKVMFNPINKETKSLTFTISGVVKHLQHSIPLRFQSHLSSDSKIQVVSEEAKP